jgi:uncharacterized protein (TIGR02284 family)
MLLDTQEDTMTEGGKEPNEAVGQLNSLLRGEISAKETYVQAIEKLGIEGRGEVEVLRDIAREHADAVDRLKDAVQQAGGTPAGSSGVWGAFARTVEGSAKALGDAAAIKALKEGEEHGLKDYESALENVDPNSQRLIAALIPAQRKHIQQLDSLLAQR